MGIVSSTSDVFADCIANLVGAKMHEKVHVAHYEIWGTFLFFGIPAAKPLKLIQGRYAYFDNRFETAARQADQEAY
jgi:hypothetical protein